MWWTPFIGDIDYKRQCGNIECLFTENRKYLDNRNLKVSKLKVLRLMMQKNNLQYILGIPFLWK